MTKHILVLRTNKWGKDETLTGEEYAAARKKRREAKQARLKHEDVGQQDDKTKAGEAEPDKTTQE